MSPYQLSLSTTYTAAFPGSAPNSVPGRGSLGFIQYAMIAPNSSKPMLPRNGRSQLPVFWITYPATSGDTAAAKADPIFINPLAVPENRGAMSMGIAQNGPMVNSAKKNAALKQMATVFKSCDRSTGIMKASDNRKPAITRLRRALLRSPVFFRMKSLTHPPAASPTTPSRYTPLANNAELFKLSL